MLNFKNWLIIENTISQTIKKKYKEIFDKMYKSVNAFIRTRIMNMSENSYEILTKWYIYNYIEYLKDNELIEGARSYRTFFYPNGEPITIGHVDYLTSKIDEKGNLEARLKSKLNDPSFTLEKLERMIELWHFSLESKKRLPGEKGETILDLSKPIEPKNLTLLGSEWEGWKWVDLGKGYCDKEGKSMGHCGNAGAELGDNILSLRDSKNIPHLTFILNNGILGQMKGRQNDKPSEKYHPAIIELLKTPIIKQVRGGGYKPENNFSLNDLEEDMKEELLALKPDLEFDIFEDLEKQMEETRKENNVEDWNFAYEYCTLEDAGDGTPAIHLHGGFSTILKVKLKKHLPAYGKELNDLKHVINIEISKSRVNHFEDIEFRETKKGLEISAYIPTDGYYGSEIDNFKSFIDTLKNSVEGFEQEYQAMIQRALVEKGYLAPYYIKQVTKESGKLGWSYQKFKNFNWETDVDDSKHLIRVIIFNYMMLGKIKNENEKGYLIENFNEEKIKNALDNELMNISNEIQNIENKQKSFLQKNTTPAYHEKIKIKPSSFVKVQPQRKDWNKAWDAETNPVHSFNVLLSTDLEISQLNSYEEAKDAERFLHFVDNNYDLIKNRLIARFKKEALSMNKKLI